MAEKNLAPDSDPPLRSLPFQWNTLPRWPLLIALRMYQLTLSRLIAPDTCRFWPTCSHYAYQAIFKYGVVKGGWMGFKRLLRCQPFVEGGYDPVP
jgi:putative membrane protein insertion efficiency factor